MHGNIVIVGGGAGGLELACRLGRKLGPARVTLVDSQLYHVWKPSLHEVAAGTLDIHQEGLSYQMLAHDCGFTYVYGALVGLDADARRLTVDAIRDADGGLVLPVRHIDYQTLVLAVGSVSHYFGVPGAAEHAISLNGVQDAERFRLTMLKLLTRTEAHTAGQRGVDIVIIGGGATGVELAAELREASGVYADYGLGQLDPRRDVRITVLEGAPRILAPLPQQVADAALKLLGQRAVTVATDTHVTEVGADFVQAGAVRYPADLCVWAAGIAAPPLLSRLGLATAKGGQIVVDATLAVPGHPDIYALGDCAACPGADGKPLPARAQVAHQQASYLARILLSRERDSAVSGPHTQPDPPYVYRDYGALVSFGQHTSVGTLMGALRGAHWFVEGTLARLMYASLHLMHHRAVLGAVRTAVLALARFLVRRSRPLVKLH
jgi:NADH dehydrogenase